MTYVSFFEQQSRNATAVSVLNTIRRKLKNSAEVDFNENQNLIICKLFQMIKGDSQASDYMSYYFSNSGDIINTIATQIFKILNKVIGNDKQKKQKLVTSLQKFTNNQLSNKDIEYLIKISEDAILEIDQETRQFINKIPLNVNSKGF